MSYYLQPGEAIDQGLRRILDEQISRAQHGLRQEGQARDQAVHDARKCFKKARAVLRLVRPEVGKLYKKKNVYFRDLGRELASYREQAALVECYRQLRQAHPDALSDEAIPAERVYLAIRQATVASSEAAQPDSCQAVAESLDKALAELADWPLPTGRDFDRLAGGVRKTYARGRKAMKHAARNPSAESFHDWRKRVKYHWYHVRLLRNIWPDVMKGRRDSLKTLSDRLGENHDLDDLLAVIAAEDETIGTKKQCNTLRKIIAAEQTRLRSEAFQIGQHLYVEKPDDLVDRWADQWDAWIAETAGLTEDPPWDD
jgi:CHAD domain-containing protein